MRSSIVLSFFILSQSIGSYTGWKLIGNQAYGVSLLWLIFYIMDLLDFYNSKK